MRKKLQNYKLKFSAWQCTYVWIGAATLMRLSHEGSALFCFGI